MIKKFHANKARLRRHQRIRRHLEGNTGRPRLNIFRSGQHIYAQIIDDTTGLTLVAASSLDETLRDFKPAAPSVSQEQAGAAQSAEAEEVDVAAQAAPVKGRGAKTEKSAKAPAKGGQPQKGTPGKAGKPGTQAKTVLPQAQKGSKKTPVEALAGDFQQPESRGCTGSRETGCPTRKREGRQPGCL